MTVLQSRATIGGKPIYDAPRGDAQSNWFEMGQGPLPGVGRVIVASTDWTQIAADADLRLKVWTRDASLAWSTDPKLNIPVVVHAALPFLQGRKASGNDKFIELHLHDARFSYAFNSTINQAFNVQVNGFTYSAGVPTLYAATTNAGTPYTWSSLLDAIGIGYSTFTFPTVAPRNFVLSGVPKSEAAQRIAAILHCCIRYQWNLTSGYLHLIKAGESVAANDALWTEFVKNPILMTVAKFNDKRYPQFVDFNFRATLDGGDPYDLTSRWYVSSRATGYGSGLTRRGIDVGYWLAKTVSGVASNAAELEAIATYLLAANVIDAYSEVGDAKAPDIVPFVPDGKFRRVLWRFDAHELTTHVRVNSDLPIQSGVACSPTIQSEPLDDTFVVRTIDGRTQHTDVPDNLEIDAIIIGNSASGTNRWRYAWTSAVLDGDQYVREDPPTNGGSIGGDYAVNGEETGNSATYMAYGLRLDGPDFPPGMNVIAIGSDFEGNLHDVHVRMRRTTDVEGNVRWAFNATNQVDGPCA